MRAKTYTRTMWAIGGLVCIVIAGAVSIRWKERADEVAAASKVASNYASVVAEQVSDASLAVELSLRAVIDRQIDMGSPASFLASISSRTYYEHLTDALGRLPQADVITITDAAGRIVTTTRGFPAPDVDLSDRDYFLHLRNSGPDEIYISAPVHNKVTGVWTVYFARGLWTASGEFLGVALIGVRPEVFVRTQSSLAKIEGQSFLLLRNDGVVFMRRPDTVDRTGEPMPASSEWYDIVAKGGGMYRSPGYFDRQPRYVAVRPLARYPLVVNVAISEDAALAKWKLRSWISGSVGVLFVAILGLLVWILRRQYQSMEQSRGRLQRREEDLAASNQRIEAALENMSHGLAMFDRDERLVVSNRQYAEMYGLDPADMHPGMTIDDVTAIRLRTGLYENQPPEIVDQLTARREFDRRTVRLRNGRAIAIRRRKLPADGGWITTHEDVTEEIERSMRMEFLAAHDPLTGLANRAEFIKRLGEALESQELPRRRPALLLVDLDGFKAINDAFGHGVGDELLHKIAARLAEAAPNAVVSRLGGDEFAVLHYCADDPIPEAEGLAARLMSETKRAFSIGPREISISFSIGVAVADETLRQTERLMRWADLALYRAKREGRHRYRLFEEQMESDFQAQTDLAADLRDAIAAGQLDLHYQPIVRASTGDVVAMEALARWSHPTRGPISPVVFIPLAEECGLICALGEFVLRRACIDASAWPEDVKVAVNCSSLQISQGDFVDVIQDAIAISRLPAQRLEIEITESALLRQDDCNIDLLHAVRELGVSIALDDFGTGYSSLSYLKIFPFDNVKIDKSFVDDVNDHAGCAAIIGATTMLARSFDIVTTAEGVETREQFEALRAAGVELMQGFYFGPPRPFAEWRIEAGKLVSSQIVKCKTLAA